MSLLAVPIAFRVRRAAPAADLTTILVIPITLGTVLIAEGLLNYLGPQGWFNRTPDARSGSIDGPIRLMHNYSGVMLSLIISGFPFTFLLTLSYVTGIDPVAGAGRRDARRRCALSASATSILPLLVPGLAITFCLSFVQAFSVFPSAVLLGAPAGADARDLDRGLSGGLRGSTITRWPRRSR